MGNMGEGEREGRVGKQEDEEGEEEDDGKRRNATGKGERGGKGTRDREKKRKQKQSTHGLIDGLILPFVFALLCAFGVGGREAIE